MYVNLETDNVKQIYVQTDLKLHKKCVLSQAWIDT